MSEKDFDRFLLEAVDEGLSSMGESSKLSVYFHLEKGFKIKRLEIPHKVEEFACAMEKIFGLGANFLEILIMKSLHEKIKRNVQLKNSKNFTFAAYVAAAKQSFLKGNRQRVLVNAGKCSESENYTHGNYLNQTQIRRG